MHGKSWWIVSISVALAAGGVGCGGSSSTTGKGGSGGSGGSAAAGHGGTTGSAGATGTAGTTGSAGTTGGGGTTGTGGQSGTVGTAGTGGSAGRGGAGGTVGTGGAGGAGGRGGTTGSGGIGGATGGTGGAVNCSPGASCTGTETCSAPCAGGQREIACFCAPNGLFACEACLPVDSGVSGTGGTGVDAGVPACTTAAPMGTDCSGAGTMCETTCSGGMAQSCMCQVSAAGGPDGGPAMRWRCQNVRCQ